MQLVGPVLARRLACYNVKTRTWSSRRGRTRSTKFEMAKSSIRKTDPTDTTAPAKRRRAAATDMTEGAAVKGPRPRRKTDAVVAAALTPAVIPDATNGPIAAAVDVPHDQIAVRAYHIFLERGYPGDSFNDWVTAERELREQFARTRQA